MWLNTKSLLLVYGASGKMDCNFQKQLLWEPARVLGCSFAGFWRSLLVTILLLLVSEYVGFIS